MFDFAALDLLTPSEEGRDMTLTHPRTGQPWLDSAGRPVTITLLGAWSGVYQQTLEGMQARLDARPAGAPPLTYAEKISGDAELLAAVTRRWSFTELDGKPYPCTPDNARLLYADERFGWVRARANAFVRNDGNFLAEPPPPASPGRSEASA